MKGISTPSGRMWVVFLGPKFLRVGPAVGQTLPSVRPFIHPLTYSFSKYSWVPNDVATRHTAGL